MEEQENGTAGDSPAGIRESLEDIRRRIGRVLQFAQTLAVERDQLQSEIRSLRGVLAQREAGMQALRREAEKLLNEKNALAAQLAQEAGARRKAEDQMVSQRVRWEELWRENARLRQEVADCRRPVWQRWLQRRSGGI